MNKRRCTRYERFEASSGTRYYDRRNHAVAKEIISEDTGAWEQEDICAASCYPHKLLSKIKIHPFMIDLAILWILMGYIWHVADLRFVTAIPKGHGICYAAAVELSILVLSIFLHELSHGIAAVSQGAFVAEIGVAKAGLGFQYFTKVIWDSPSKWEKMRFFFSGVAMNMFLSVIGIVLFIDLDRQCGFYLYLTNTFFTVFNLLPVKCMNSDGYHMMQVVLKKKENKKRQK